MTNFTEYTRNYATVYTRKNCPQCKIVAGTTWSRAQDGGHRTRHTSGGRIKAARISGGPGRGGAWRSADELVGVPAGCAGGDVWMIILGIYIAVLLLSVIVFSVMTNSRG